MLPRGLRNNNPLNIRHSASRWRGMREEQTDKCFVQFESMALGLRAAFCLLRSYSRRGLETPAEIVARWAPSTENNTEGYIRIVCRLTRGETLEAGQRYGMIKLGSRVDVYLPRDVKLAIKMGDQVYAGVSLLGAVER